MSNLRIVNTGSGPSSNDGDQLRVAFEKINSNFTDIVSGNIVVGSAQSGGTGTSGNVASSLVSTYNATITTNSETLPLTWKFTSTGSVEFPDGSIQSAAFNPGSYYTKTLVNTLLNDKVDLITFNDGLDTKIGQAELDAAISQISFTGGGAGDLTNIATNVIASEDAAKDLGSSDRQWQNVYATKVTINGNEITSNNGNINLPAGTTVGGVVVGSLKILGSFSYIQDLPLIGNQLGDSYLVEGNLYAWNGTNFVNLGPFRGPAGYAGSRGTLGYAGSVGGLGYTGSRGAGYAGSAGATGATGPSGPRGYDGPVGASGATGPAGASGARGYSGSLGSTGPQGPVGATGPQGISIHFLGTVANPTQLPGNPAVNDAYIVEDYGDLYVWNGAAWTNVGQIVGPQGEPGFVGSRGVTGFVGSVGGLGYTGSIGFTGSAGLADWKIVSSEYTAADKERLMLDTTGGSFYLTLPANPVVGTYVQVTDGADLSLNSVIINPGVNTIEGSPDYVSLDVADATYEFIYNGSSWQITSTYGPQGDRGYTGSQGGAGSLGYTGSIGYSGSSGEAGPSGPTGPRGFTGFTGPTGPTGYVGSQGVTGYVGSKGDVGASGVAGLTGATGPTGATGLTGPTGPTGIGATGATGPSGTPGATGVLGYAGSRGLTGATGPIGLTGATGATGATGLTGFTGATGLVGATGATGPRGFDGLVGATGPIGYTGSIGPLGAAGPVGATGASGPDGYTGSKGDPGSVATIRSTYIPASAYGQAGDRAGDTVVDANPGGTSYVYICYADYTDSTSPIWVKTTGTILF